MARFRELLDKNRDGSLTPGEETALDTLQSLNHLFALVKIQARQEMAAAQPGFWHANGWQTNGDEYLQWTTDH